MSPKTNLGVIYGGKSTEHEISLKSAMGIIGGLNPEKYQLHFIYITKQGAWRQHSREAFEATAANPASNQEGDELVIRPGQGRHAVFNLKLNKPLDLDVIFPILHGHYGEDGCIQGLLQMAEIPFVGTDVLGSACGMDKDFAKRLMDQAGIPNAPYLVLRSHETRPGYKQVAETLGETLFVKPARQGSSVGISKVTCEDQWSPALDEAFQFDEKVVIESAIQGQEIEISVLGNEHPRASTPGEILPKADFYSYDAKYIDSDGAKLLIPANIPQSLVESMQELAKKTYQILGCEGMTRVDFFVQGEKLFINEINTIPGFTPISMYPKLWEASGLGMQDLLDELIQLAVSRFNQQAKKRNSFQA